MRKYIYTSSNVYIEAGREWGLCTWISRYMDGWMDESYQYMTLIYSYIYNQ